MTAKVGPMAFDKNLNSSDTKGIMNIKEPNNDAADGDLEQRKVAKWIKQNIKIRPSYKPVDNKENINLGCEDMVPTDAFGEIHFAGFGGYTPKFVRVDVQTKMNTMLELFTKVWGMQKPNLLISVTGGAKSFNLHMKPRLRDVFRRGLMKAAHSTGAWILTGGTYAGVMKHVGEAVKEYGLTSTSPIPVVAIGIAPWGVIQNRDNLVRQQGSWPADYGIEENANQSESFLDPNHSHFILVDDGTEYEFATEINFRAKLEREISQMQTDEKQTDEKQTDKRENTVSVPIVILVLDGGPGTLETVQNALKQNTPAVIVKGSGRAADILAYAFKYAERVDKQELDIKITWKQMNPSLENDIRKRMRDIKFCKDEKIDQNIQRIKDCLAKSELIQIFEWDQSSGARDMDEGMLKALLKANKNQVLSKLKQALSWRRPANFRDCKQSTTAISGDTRLQLDADNFEELILDTGISLKEFLTIQRLLQSYNKPDGIEVLMLSAIKQNSVNFVQLFLNNGFSLNMFLTDIGLLQLYNNVPSGNFLKILLEKTPKENKELNKEISPKQVDQLKKDLLGEYCSPHSKPKRKDTVHSDNPEWELFIWSVLSNQQEMAKLYWLHGKDGIAAALVASALLRTMSLRTDDNALSAKIKSNASEFMNMAIGLLNKCYSTNKKKTQDLLTRKLSQWGQLSCAIIAVKEKNKEFISQPACRELLDNIWMGKLSKENSTWKLLALIAFPPLIIWCAKFKEIEEDEVDFVDGTTSCKEQDRNKNLKQRDHSLQIEHSADPSGNNSKSFNIVEKLVYFYRAPVIVFFHNVIAYMVFLGLYSYVLISQLEETLSAEEIVLIVWVIAMFIQEIEQVATTASLTRRKQFLTYIKDGLNKADIIMISMFAIGMTLRLIPNTHTLEAAHIFFGVNLITFFLRLLHIFSVHEDLGPKIEMIIRMVRNLAGFALILFTFVVAYAIASHSVLYPNTELTFDTFIAIFRRPYWNIYGELMLDEVEGSAKCTNLAELYKNGTYSRCPTVSGKYFVPILMGVYMLMCNILLLNLLVAIFSYTIQKVQDNAEIHWCFQRYKLIDEYCHRSFLAPPCVFVEPFFVLISMYLNKFWLRFKEEDNVFSKNISNEDDLCEFESVMARTLHHKKKKEQADAEISNHRVKQLLKKIDELQEQQQSLTVTVEGVQSRPSQNGLASLKKRLKNVEKQSKSTLDVLHWIVESLNEHQLVAKRTFPALTDLRPKEKKQDEKRTTETHVAAYQMQEGQVMIHPLFRTSPYPGTSIYRFEVPSDNVPWEVAFLEYNPPTYTSSDVLSKPEWADKMDLYQVLVDQRSKVIRFNGADYMTNTSRVSYTGKYRLHNGIPLNPMGRTGLRGRGNFGRWGPNHAMDTIITRWRYGETGQKMMEDDKPVFEFVAVKSVDTGLWALPEAILPPGHLPTENLKIEFSEEALIAIGEDRQQVIKTKMKKILQNGELIHQGYADNPRNTDNAWLESAVYLYHDEEDVLRYFSLTAGASNYPTAWLTASSKLPLYGAHSYFIKLVAEILDASF